jgi:hypothetical protein
MDRSIAGDMTNIPEEDQQRMTKMIEQFQIRDRLVYSLLCCTELLFAIMSYIKIFHRWILF